MLTAIKSPCNVQFRYATYVNSSQFVLFSRKILVSFHDGARLHKSACKRLATYRRKLLWFTKSVQLASRSSLRKDGAEWKKVTVYLPGESEKNVGRLANCDIAFSHPIVVN